MGRAATVVDVAAVGRGVQHVDARARGAQRARPDLERGAVRAVEHDVAVRRAPRPSSVAEQVRDVRVDAAASAGVARSADAAVERATPVAVERARLELGFDRGLGRRRASLRPSAPMTFTPLSGHGLWLAETIAAGTPSRCGQERDRRASGSTPSEHDVDALGREPGGQVGLDARARLARVAPDEERAGAEHPRRGATERDDERSREVGVRVAADAVGAEAQHARRRRATAWSTAAPCGPS